MKMTMVPNQNSFLSVRRIHSPVFKSASDLFFLESPNYYMLIFKLFFFSLKKKKPLGLYIYIYCTYMRMNEKRLFFCSEQDEFSYTYFGRAYI